MSAFFPTPQIEKSSLADSMDSYQSPVLLEAGPQTALISPLKNLVKDQLIVEVGCDSRCLRVFQYWGL